LEVSASSNYGELKM